LHCILLAAVMAAIILASWGAHPALAASIVVDSALDNTTANNNLCTLREAINNANANSDTTSGDCTAGSGAFPFVNKIGTTQLRLRFVTGDNNDNGADVLNLFSGNAISASRPYLVVWYLP
jgi:CSLREA domain-containing protein